MARLALSLTIGTLIAISFAGCLEDAPVPIDPESLPHSHMMTPTMGEFVMDMGVCEEGGFVAAYPLSEQGSKLANGSWTRADITKEIGEPIRDGNGRPVNGKLWGNWHQGYRCTEVDFNGVKQKEFLMGWIGNMIEPPAWDEGGADLHFVVSGLGVQNGTIADLFKESNTAAISMAKIAKVDWIVPRMAPRSAAYVEYTDVQKGTYLSASELYKYRDVSARTVRLWWQVPIDGSDEMPHGHAEGAEGMDDPMHAGPLLWHPVYWDIVSAGSEQYVTPPVDSPEVACHTGAGDAHGGVGAACQPTLTNVHEHKALTFVQGHVFSDVTLDAKWDH